MRWNRIHRNDEIGTSTRLAAALGVEGATELGESAFSSDNVTITLGCIADGKAKATITRRVKDNAPVGQLVLPACKGKLNFFVT